MNNPKTAACVGNQRPSLNEQYIQYMTGGDPDGDNKPITYRRFIRDDTANVGALFDEGYEVSEKRGPTLTSVATDSYPTSEEFAMDPAVRGPPFAVPSRSEQRATGMIVHVEQMNGQLRKGLLMENEVVQWQDIATWTQSAGSRMPSQYTSAENGGGRAGVIGGDASTIGGHMFFSATSNMEASSTVLYYLSNSNRFDRYPLPMSHGGGVGSAMLHSTHSGLSHDAAATASADIVGRAGSQFDNVPLLYGVVPQQPNLALDDDDDCIEDGFVMV